jgi:hypothetical protein
VWPGASARAGRAVGVAHAGLRGQVAERVVAVELVVGRRRRGRGCRRQRRCAGRSGWRGGRAVGRRVRGRIRTDSCLPTAAQLQTAVDEHIFCTV